MYIINEFVFGHEMAKDKKLNNLLAEYDLEFSKYIGTKKFVVDFPYHGGQTNISTKSCIFGIKITDDDHNKKYIQQIKSAKEQDYLPAYEEFLKSYIEHVKENYGSDLEYDGFVDKLIKFLNENKPKFYSVESSS